jgi:hypothetical protein
MFFSVHVCKQLLGGPCYSHKLDFWYFGLYYGIIRKTNDVRLLEARSQQLDSRPRFVECNSEPSCKGLRRMQRRQQSLNVQTDLAIHSWVLNGQKSTHTYVQVDKGKKAKYS